MSGNDLPMRDGLMEYAVERLREATTNRNAILTNLTPAAGTTEEQFEEAARESQPTRQAIEDVALNVLGDVYHARLNYSDVEEAVARAEARWLYPVILDRALEAVGGDA